MRTKSLLTLVLATGMLAGGMARAADQKTFTTPSEAVQALVKAAEDGSQEEMVAVLGDDGKELVYTGDPVQDKKGM